MNPHIKRANPKETCTLEKRNINTATQNTTLEILRVRRKRKM